jgi:putative transcriptional regulator
MAETPAASRNRYDAAMLESAAKGPARTRRTAWLAVCALVLLGGAGAAPAASVADGTLLIASPELEDPNFAHTVVLVLRNDTNGTIGVILNRPTTLVPSKIFPELAAGVGSYTGKLFRGGPIASARLLFLVRGLAAATVQGPEVVEKVFLAGDPETLPDIVRLADGAKELRMYAGHAEWMPGQLDREIAAGGWKTQPATAEIVFHAKPTALWDELTTRSGETVADAGAR